MESPELTDDSQKVTLTEKIDSLKEEFNVTGKDVSEAKTKLESTLELMQKKEKIYKTLENWIQTTTDQLSTIELQSSNHKKQADVFNEMLGEMTKFKRSYLDLYKIFEDVSALITSPTLIKELKLKIESLEHSWQILSQRVRQKITLFCQVVPAQSKIPDDINTQLKCR